jgi:hypothetical protein
LYENSLRGESNNNFHEPPERVAETPVYFRNLIDDELARLATEKYGESVGRKVEEVNSWLFNQASNPEEYNEKWWTWKMADMLHSQYKQNGFDYETCNDIANMTIEEAVETAYRYLVQAGLDPKDVLINYLASQTIKLL